MQFEGRTFYINVDQLDKYEVASVLGVDYIRIGTVESVVISPETFTSFAINSQSITDALFIDNPSNNITSLLVKKDEVVANAKFTAIVVATSSVESITRTYTVHALQGFIVNSDEIDDIESVWAFDLSNDMKQELTNEDVILQNVTDILMTGFGERLFRIDDGYGSILQSSIFGSMNEFSGETFLDKLFKQISIHQTKAVVIEKQASMEIFENKSMIQISIPFYIPSTRKNVLYRKQINF